MPVHAQFGVHALGARPGHIEFGQRMGPWLLDRHGRLCPGAFLVAADAALGSAIASTLDGTSVMSLTLHAEFVTLDPGDAAGFTVRGGGVQASAGSGFATGEIIDDTGRLIARISTHCGFLPLTLPPGSAAVGYPISAAPEPAELGALRAADTGTELAPIAAHRAGATLFADHADDAVQVRATSTPAVRNGRGDLQGGVLGLLAEQAITACLLRGTPTLARATAAELDIAYLRPVRAEVPDVVLVARSEHAGRRFALARAQGRDGAGRLVVSASGSRYAP